MTKSAVVALALTSRDGHARRDLWGLDNPGNHNRAARTAAVGGSGCFGLVAWSDLPQSSVAGVELVIRKGVLASPVAGRGSVGGRRLARQCQLSLFFPPDHVDQVQWLAAGAPVVDMLPTPSLGP
jgi:hypothetical protein